MDTATAIAQLTSLIGQRKIELAFLEMSLATLNQTYEVSLQQLDETKIALTEALARIVELET